MMECITCRDRLIASDRIDLKEVLASTGMFYDFEIDVALEIIELFLKDGEKTGYYFYVLESEGRAVGYVNFGPTPCTVASWDMYWMAVRKDLQGAGWGRKLLEMAEKRIFSMGGKNIWIETSSRDAYVPTQIFYSRNGYELFSRLPDFYDTGDDRLVFGKKQGGLKKD
ncbi:MAG TPA: N-acetyltransferase [Porphyromonadaceae bacterium]|nr:N-acetyltransferase [Porphyromonadaceae bacterium]